MKTLVLSATSAQQVHLFFEWLAIATGFQLYRLQRMRNGQSGVLQSGTYAVTIGCILGAAVGNKLVFWLEFPHLWSSRMLDLNLWMSGQSIVGGLLGGLLGVEIAKKLVAVKRSTGDDFVLPLMAGTVVGRIGCFLAGLNDGTFGNATTLPWGVDFGDGVLRHPTQIYDMVFVIVWGGFLLWQRRRWETRPGLIFKCYLAGYLAWRLLVDGIKPVPFDMFAGLSGIQVTCLVALVCYMPLLLKQILRAEDHVLI